MELKNLHLYLYSYFHYFVLAGVLIFFVFLYLGYDEMQQREVLEEDEIDNIKKKWDHWFDSDLKTDTKENFKEKEETKKNTKKKIEKPDILEIDEEEEKKNHKKREGAKDIFKEIGKFFKKIDKVFKDIGSFFKKFPKMMSGLLKKAGDAVKKGIITPMMNFFAKITKPILTIFGYVECGIKKIGSFFVCSKWYLLQLIGIIIYFPYRMLFFFSDTVSIEKQLWYYVYYLDSIFHDITGAHFAHFPDDVNNLCYKCKKR